MGHVQNAAAFEQGSHIALHNPLVGSLDLGPYHKLTCFGYGLGDLDVGQEGQRDATGDPNPSTVGASIFTIVLCYGLTLLMGLSNHMPQIDLKPILVSVLGLDILRCGAHQAECTVWVQALRCLFMLVFGPLREIPSPRLTSKPKEALYGGQ